MAKDFTCTQVRANNGTANCNVEEEIKFEFTFDIKQKLEEEINEEFDKKINDKIKEAESKVKSEVDKLKADITTQKGLIGLSRVDLNVKKTFNELTSLITKSPALDVLFEKARAQRENEIKTLEEKLAKQEEALTKLEEELSKVETALEEEQKQITDALNTEKAGRITDIPNLIDPIIKAIKVNFSINETIVVQDVRIIQKPLELVTSTPAASDVEAVAKLTFPESLAGAALQIDYAFEYIGTTDTRTINITAGLQSTITIKRADGLKEIEKAYWSEQEHALWGAKLTVQKELCKNETGFLHIYTKGMFGKQVFTEYWSGGSSSDKLGTIHPVSMRDNVVSIPYPMSRAIADYTAKHSSPPGATMNLYGIASKANPVTAIKNTEILTLQCNQDAANPQQPTTAPPVKIKITTDEEAISEPTKAKCILQFRPDNTYIGDYGFDWLRMGDTGPSPTPAMPADQRVTIAAGYHNDYDYEDHMGVHYYDTSLPVDQHGIDPIPVTHNNQIEHNGNNKGNVFKKDKDTNTTVFRPENNWSTGTYTPGTVADNTFGDGKMYNKLKLRYRRLLFNWDSKDNAGTSSKTYTPIMSIMNGKIADLVLHLDIKEEPKEIIFKFDNNSANNFFDLDATDWKITSNLAVTAATDKTTHKLKITCKGEFNQEYTLFAHTYKKDNPTTGEVDTKGEVCGMLRILPNAPMYQHKVKILFIGVETNINGGLTNKIGTCPTNAEDKFKDVLGQALVIPEIIITKEDGTDLIINTLAPQHASNALVDFKNDFCIDKGGGNFVIDDEDAGNTGKGRKLKTYLLDELSCIDNNKYKNYYKIFYFDEAVNTHTAGYSWGEKYVICFNSVGTLDMLPVHEVLHSLELAHPFDAYSRNTPFSHHFCTTDNVMDYTQSFGVTNTRTLFHWQWQIINTKIR